MEIQPVNSNEHQLLSSSIDDSIRQWAKQHVGGLLMNADGSEERVYGLLIPLNSVLLKEIYDNEVFPRYMPIAELGKKKLVERKLNTANDKDELISDAEYFQPLFIQLLHDSVISHMPQVSFSSGPNQRDMIKSFAGLDFKLSYKHIEQVADMIRTTIICPSVEDMLQAITFLQAHLDSNNFHYSVVNFYHNIWKFGSMDRNEGVFDGYGGYHVRVILENEDKTRILSSEIQFHPSTFYDGTDASIKAIGHAAYRAWHTRDARATPTLQETVRSAREMYHCYAFDKFV